MAKARDDAKDKIPKLGAAEAASVILAYLQHTNRPYSAKEISENIRAAKTAAITQSAAQKLLKELHERKEIEGKAAGKSCVYFALQPEPEDGFHDKLAAATAETARLREEVVALRDEEKELRLSLRQGAHLVPLADLKKDMAAMAADKAALAERLAKLQSGSVTPVDPARRDRINTVHTKISKQARNRKKIRKELLECILDSMHELSQETVEQWKEDHGVTEWK